MKLRGLSVPVMKTMIRLKKQNKSTRAIAKTSDVVKLPIQVKKKKKAQEDLRKQLWLRIKKKIGNTLQELGVSASKWTIRTRLHLTTYRGFTTRCAFLIITSEILWPDVTKINCYQNNENIKLWKREGTVQDAFYLQKPNYIYIIYLIWM